MSRKLDSFTQAYVLCALWSTNDESDESGGEPLDANYSIADISDETLEKMKADCEKFQFYNEIPEYRHNEYSDDEMAGHDFWLTRNGHGVGFWDGALPEDIGKKLTEESKKYGSFDLYMGDDGKIYAM